jgi:hypothetical protein
VIARTSCLALLGSLSFGHPVVGNLFCNLVIPWKCLSSEEGLSFLGLFHVTQEDQGRFSQAILDPLATLHVQVLLGQVKEDKMTCRMCCPFNLLVEQLVTSGCRFVANLALAEPHRLGTVVILREKGYRELESLDS